MVASMCACGGVFMPTLAHPFHTSQWIPNSRMALEGTPHLQTLAIFKKNLHEEQTEITQNAFLNVRASAVPV